MRVFSILIFVCLTSCGAPGHVSRDAQGLIEDEVAVIRGYSGGQDFGYFGYSLIVDIVRADDEETHGPTFLEPGTNMKVTVAPGHHCFWLRFKLSTWAIVIPTWSELPPEKFCFEMKAGNEYQVHFDYEDGQAILEEHRIWVVEKTSGKIFAPETRPDSALNEN